jgi:hypothetical protein
MDKIASLALKLEIIIDCCQNLSLNPYQQE